MSSPATGPLVVALLGVRFLVELGLFAAPTVIGVAATDSAAGVVLGVVVSLVVVVLWGVALSPRRRVNPPVAARVTIELALIAAAGVGLVLAGLTAWGIALVAAELISMLWLAVLGLPPGADVGTSSTPAAGEQPP